MIEEDKEEDSISNLFDVRQFLNKLLDLWWLFTACFILGISFAYYKNQFIQTFYEVDALLSIKDNSNPLFTSNTSLTFNWGGTTDKVTTAITQFKSRSHAEQVVDELQYYINYIKEGEYYDIDAYKQTPFFVYANTSFPQLQGVPIHIKVLNQNEFELSADFSSTTGKAFNYQIKKAAIVTTPQGSWKKKYKFGAQISLPFFNAVIEKTQGTVSTGSWSISFADYWETVNTYKEISILQKPEGSSIIQLSLKGTNKQRLIDYINSSSVVLEKGELERKNKFAVSTIAYIDSSLVAQVEAIKLAENELENFKSSSQLIDAGMQNTSFNQKLTNYELQRTDAQNKLDYYSNLRNYLSDKTDYTSIQAPTVVGINEGSIVASVSKLIALSEERKRREFAMREDAPVFKEIDRDINAIKGVIFENISSSKGQLNQELKRINSEIYQLESQIKALPKEQQEFLKIQRQFDLKQNAYNIFLARKAEAELVKAANVSDIYVIDEAKDVGQLGRRKDSNINYLIAVLLAIAIPFLIAFILTLMDNYIHTPKELEKLSSVPLLGIVGVMKNDNNLIVKDQPNSTIAESFRGLRSSLHFLYNPDSTSSCKTIMVTSSVSGEGKTFTSINLATVLALSNKKTILVGLDLRKPKIFDDFKLKNNIGVSSYLVNDCTLEEAIQATGITNLDLILSGPLPPNPSELILSRRATEMIERLKNTYDYIILDTPPLGLVADAMEIAKHVDATLYVVRHNFTRKAMLQVINEKYDRKELKNVSLVFNSYKNRGMYGYDYGYGYGNYGYGQEAKSLKRNILDKLMKFFKNRYKK